MKLLLAKIPSETLNYILCDVLSTYIHAFVMLPPGYPCWPAHYVLRRVSRHFKSLVDYIWGFSVGNGQWELRKLRMATSTRDLKQPGDNLTPLVKAYISYVQTFDEELRSEDGPDFQFQIVITYRAFQLALGRMDELITQVMPQDMSKTLSDAVDWNKARRETGGHSGGFRHRHNGFVSFRACEISGGVCRDE